MSAAFDQIVQAPSRLERCATGFRFTEGPVWCTEDRSLLFSDIPADRIFRLTAAGEVEIFREPSGNSNGLALDREGRLIACEHGPRRVTRTEKDGSITVLASTFRGGRLNSPNDVVVKSDGAIYFTDPTYGIRPNEAEQPQRGVYRIPSGGGEPALVADDFDQPNGLVFSPDERTLYVDDSSPRRHVRVFDVNPDGSLANSRVFVDMNVRRPGTPDGMTVDAEGRLYCTGPGGIWVISESGERLGLIVTPEPARNCVFGGADLRTLYITAGSSIHRATLTVPGVTPACSLHADT